jgi:plasmid stabilization system protein ParE
VSTFLLSLRAETDLLAIATHTLRTWGDEQVIRYINDLENCCRMLARNPNIGPAVR